MDEEPIDEAIYEIQRAMMVHAEGARYDLNSQTRRDYHSYMHLALDVGLTALRARKGERHD